MRILFFVLISAVLFYSCEEELDFSDSIFETDPETIDPTTTLLTNEVDPTNSTVTFSWEGNDFSNAFNFKLVLTGYDNIMVSQDYFDWMAEGGWTNSTNVTFEGLDEGSYTFYVKSRFSTGIEESTPQTFDFIIDAISGPALRMYPLKQKVSSDGYFDIYLFAEDISCDNSQQIDVFAIEAILSYDSNLSFIASETGSLVTAYETLDCDGFPSPEILDFPVDGSIAETLTISTGIAPSSDTCPGLSGTDAIVKLTFQYSGSDPSTTIYIDAGLLANPFSGHSNQIESTKMVQGLIEVVE